MDNEISNAIQKDEPKEMIVERGLTIACGVIINFEHFLNKMCTKYEKLYDRQFFHDCYLGYNNIYDSFSIFESFLRNYFTIIDSYPQNLLLVLDVKTNKDEVEQAINNWIDQQIKELADRLEETREKEKQFVETAKEILNRLSSEERKILKRYIRNNLGKE